MSFFMVLTDNFYWGVGNTLREAKTNARYHKGRHNALVLEFDKEPSNWRIDPLGQVWTEGAEKLQDYELIKPHGKRVDSAEEETA